MSISTKATDKMNVQQSDWRATQEAQDGIINVTVAVIVNPNGTWDAVPVIDGGKDSDFLSGSFGAKSYTLKATLPAPSLDSVYAVQAFVGEV